ncbi:phenylacetate--CoA ligase family protein [Thiohalobacter sp. IOR34]|uniref:phenylacetate--CoA ligase family protein n=1 Tax=Thiohalobacter sp. IOR34 TaxID=3057176 RepID=UPI0025B26A0F|nr:phenylacetate--CoA ligase family protein [Thiohalobacter sp. IOR34]WJW74453.1 phenylacetate--CoA ligase family protein [Thiohalobacter sp. IOR34]
MSGLYTRFVAGALFPLHERLKGHNTVAVRRELERSQWYEPEALQALQLARLQRLLQRAGERVPYYRELFARLGFDPQSLDDLAGLRSLPFLTKDLIRANQEALKAEDAVGLARFNTGGSSGQPLIFFIGRERVSHDVAAKWRATRWWGVDIGDPEIVVWGSPIELGSQDRIRALRDRLLRSRLIPAFEMSEARLADYVARIRAFRPRMLFGYPSSLAHIAAWAEQAGERLDDLGIRVAFVTSERLYDHQRETIERVFACPVANGYGGRDAGFIAHQCPAGGMHITTEDIIVELIGEDDRPVADGEPGEVVVTHLATGDYPFIRYRTGDVAVRDSGRCACGRGLPLLREIQGRTTDFIVASDGTVMHGLALIYVVRDLPGVENFRIEQLSRERTRVQLVTGDGFEEGSIEQIRNGFKARLGAEVQIDIERVASIPREKSGKFRYVVSQVRP